MKRKEIRVRPKLLGILVAVLLGLVSVQIAYAHLYGGVRWQNNTTTWYIGGGPNSVPSSWYSQYRNAATTWNNAPGSFAFSETSPTQAQGNMGAKYFSQDPNLPDSWYGATITYPSGGYLIAASSYLNRDYSWVTNGSQFPDVRTIALHEFGHWVSFVDSCSSSSLVMCVTQVKWSLSTHEKNELSAVYP